MKHSVQKLEHQKLTGVHCGQTYHTPRELAGHIRSHHADTLPSRPAPPKAKQEEKGSRVPVSVAVPSSGAQEHLQKALEGLSQRHRQIDAELARQETLQAEKEAIGKQVGALKLALQAFVGMSGVGSGSQLDIAVAESPALKTSPPASTGGTGCRQDPLPSLTALRPSLPGCIWLTRAGTAFAAERRPVRQGRSRRNVAPWKECCRVLTS
jgi:hypothetical protein